MKKSKTFYPNNLYGDEYNCCNNVNYINSFECSCHENTIFFEFDGCNLENKKELIIKEKCGYCGKEYKIKIRTSGRK